MGIFTVANKRFRVASKETGTDRPETAIALFAENPFWTVNKLAARVGVAFTTAQRAIDRLESRNIVALASESKRNRVYCARDILAILEEAPQLGPKRKARRTRNREDSRS